MPRRAAVYARHNWHENEYDNEWPADEQDWPDYWPDEGPEEWPDERRSALRVALRRRNRLRLGLASVAAIVLGAVISVGMVNARLLDIGKWAASSRPTQKTAAYSPPVITLLSPDSPAAVQRNDTSPLDTALPANVPAAPSQSLAPDKPSDYEMSLITAIGTPDKAIVVSKYSQTMHVYDHGHFVAGTYAITGRPELPTPSGVWHIFYKLAPATLYSPWGPGSTFYYPPTPVNYTMEFRDGGFLIHDAPWHHVWGPGANGWHYDPIAHEWQWGTHGCVTAPTPFIQWLYDWSPLGTTVIVY